MVDLKGGDSIVTPNPKKTKHGISMSAVKNWLMPDKNKTQQQQNQDNTPFRRMPESFMRSIRRRSLRVKRTKSLVLPEKRKSDSFVNSQEWTLSRAVPDLRLGIIGSLSSGKSALVHRYLTGSYMQEESPEGGRFKKEILVENLSHLLLIRDEGGPPELQFTAWVDAVIFVFSLENESSFNAIYNYYTKMSHFRNPAEIPLILVGTQDAISENNPRVIDDSRARKLAADLKRCTYYETCATYGLNVEKVFQDACQRIVQQRLAQSTTCLTPTNSRPSTPNNYFHPSAGGGGPLASVVANRHHISVVTAGGGGGGGNNGYSTPSVQSPTANHMSPSHTHTLSHKESLSDRPSLHPLSSSTHHLHRPPPADKMLTGDNTTTASLYRSNNAQHSSDEKTWASSSSSSVLSGGHHIIIGGGGGMTHVGENNNVTKFVAPQPMDNNVNSKEKEKDLPTPSSTPTTSRKSRRRSNLFTPSKKGDDKLKNGGDIGSGRAIPIKQGYLHKRSSKPLNKDWKKKYVTLCDDGRLTYHSSLHDYMEDSHGKEISLQYVTVKIPGQKPKGSKSIITVASGTNGSANHMINEGLGGLTLGPKDKRLTEKVFLTAYDMVKDHSTKYSNASGDEGMVLSNSNSFLNGDSIKTETSTNIKKRHRRMKSSGVKNSEYDDPDEYEFYIVSLDNKQWHFEASCSEERDEWVTAIEQQILNSLQLNESSKGKKQNNPTEGASIQSIRSRVPGNGFCVDCDAPNPDWASLNLGILMCIECSGIHRNLGSHISRVRSLDLDEWPPGHLSVMLSIGNALANSVWEHHQHPGKPSATSSREDKEHWIRSKYEQKVFLQPLPSNGVLQSVGQQLVDAVCATNIKGIVTVLARATQEEVNGTVGPRDLRTPLHLACAMGQLAVAQLLIWHNANVHALDQDGRTCFAYARAAVGFATAKHELDKSLTAEVTLAASRSLVELLLSYGCQPVDTVTIVAPATGSSTMLSGTTASSGGTLPRRRAVLGDHMGTIGGKTFEKVTSSPI